MSENIDNAAHLASLLRCPQCQGALTPVLDTGLTCQNCTICYLITNGIPIMLVDAAPADAAY